MAAHRHAAFSSRHRALALGDGAAAVQLGQGCVPGAGLFQHALELLRQPGVFGAAQAEGAL